MPASSSTDEPAARDRLARALFSPSRVALVGASPDPARLTSRPQRVLRRHGYPGAILAIHPTHTEICGDKAYPSLRAAPDSVDHALVMVPAAAVADVIADCCTMQVKVATIVSAGFAETGDTGKRRQEQIRAMAHAAGLRLLGPNCLGIVNVPGRVTLSANATLEHEELRPGGLSVVSQSGSMLGGIITRAQERGLGFSKLISVGNECDLAVGELVHLLVDDPETRAILLFLEAFRDAPVLGAAARRAFEAGKPVIALKLGRSAIGREVAATHTGAMAGADDIAQAFFRAHGIIRVEVFEALFETAQLVLGHRPPRQRRVGALTVSGGGAAMVIDRLGLANVEVVPPTPAIIESLAKKKIRVTDAPLIDLPMGRAEGGTYSTILSELLHSDHYDAVLAIQGSNATYMPEVMQERILSAQRGTKPLAVFIGPRAENALKILQDGGVAAFRTPEACADALRAYCDWREPARPTIADPDRVNALRDSVRNAGRGVLNEYDSARLLAAVGIPFAPTRVVHGVGDTADIAFPVAAKILSSDVAHKSDAGGVVLDIEDSRVLAQTVNAMLARFRTAMPKARIDGILVQSMQCGIAEVIVGYRRDHDVGPVVMVGIGGMLAELVPGYALRLAPVSAETACEMIAEAPGLAVIRGYRSRPQGDLQALALAIHTLSLLAFAETPTVLDAEINPLFVRADGVVAVDALVRIET